MQLFRVILPVVGIDKAAEFYAALLALPGERVSGGRHYFDCGGTILAVYDPLGDGDAQGSGWQFHESQYIYFSTPELEQVHDRAVQLGCEIEKGGIREMPWGERMFWLVDPFGNRLSFVQTGTEFRGWGGMEPPEIHHD